MNEGGSHQGSENHISPMAEHGGPSLDSETGSEMLGKSTDNSLEAAASDSVRVRTAGMQSKISEMHSDLIRHSPYGLWMSSGAPAVGNADWRDQGSSCESSVYWPSLFPVSSVAAVAAAGKNVTFDCPQKVPICGSDASAVSRNRLVSSDSNVVKKEPVHFRPSREQEQFNLWKMASLIRNISPSDKDKRMGSIDKDEILSHSGSLMDDGKTVERSWNANTGPSEYQVKVKSTSSGLLYPVFGSKAGNSDFDPVRKSHFGEKTAEGQRERPDVDQPSFILSLKPSEQLPANSSADVCARMKPSHTQSYSRLSVTPEGHRQARTGDAEMNRLPHNESMKGPVDNTVDVQIPSDSGRSLQHEDVASRYVGASSAESAVSMMGGVKAAQDELPACSLPISESAGNSGSLYRRRVKNLLLKRGNSLTEGTDSELPKSPRIQNHFASAFEHGDSSQSDAVPDNGCGNLNREKCDWECRSEVNSGTAVALCHSPKESDKKKRAASTGCHADSPLEQEVSKRDKLSGISCGVVNYASVSSEAIGQAYRPCVSGMDCSYSGQMTKDGTRTTCIEKGLYMNAGGLCYHGAYGTVSHSACQCCGDIAACHPSPSCHLPVKVSSAATCDAATTKCCVSHRLGALPTPTRACAAALCQLSSGVAAHASSPKCMETSSGCPFSHPGNPCTTPCHQAVVKCGCIGDGHLTVTQHSGCPHGMKKSLSRTCLARIYHQDCPQQQPADNYARPHTPCMAHTPYTPRETVTPREPDTPQASNGVGEPCTPQSVCSHRARKYPCTPTTSCYFQFPPLRTIQLDCPGGAVCQTPSCLSYARRLPSCHTPCMSPLNLTVGPPPCVAHSRTPQCCFPHQKLASCADLHRHNCVRTSTRFVAC